MNNRSIRHILTINYGKSNNGKILQDFRAGRKTRPREEARTVRQDAVVYRRLYDRVFGDQ